jgi:hypothetical protein
VLELCYNKVHALLDLKETREAHARQVAAEVAGTACSST